MDNMSRFLKAVFNYNAIVHDGVVALIDLDATPIASEWQSNELPSARQIKTSLLRIEVRLASLSTSLHAHGQIFNDSKKGTSFNTSTQWTQEEWTWLSEIENEFRHIELLMEKPS